MNRRSLLSLLLITLFFVDWTFAQSIIVDEEYSDWDSVSTLYLDSIGDDGTSGNDFITMKMSNDDRFLYFYIEFDNEFDLMEDNDVTLYIDSDNNPETGISTNGIGYELEFTFGQRTGSFSNGDVSFKPYDIGLVSAPTVTSKEFEIVIDIQSKINGQDVFLNSTMAILLVDEQAGGDQIPNEGEILTYALNEEHIFQPKAYSFSKPESADIRVISYNTRGNNLFDLGLTDRYKRVLSALDADFIAFQEVSGNGSTAFVDRMEELVPSAPGERWYAIDVGNDNVLASRFPIIESDAIRSPSNRTATYLVDYFGQELFFIASHPPCCNNEIGRQGVIDAFMQYLRDSKNGMHWNLDDQTPIFILGDMNLVGLKRQQTTLLTGDIFDEVEYGEDFNPDWDGTDLEDAKPITVGLPNVYTWYSENSSFGAGRLDYITYSGSVLQIENSFSLHTPFVDTDTLLAYGLELDDSIVMSDHVPVVADFSFKIPVSIQDESLETPSQFLLYQNYPNPFNPSTNIEFELKKTQQVQLIVYDISGQMIDIIFTGQKSAGNHQIQWDAMNYSSGIYFYQLKTESGSTTKKMILLK